MTRSSIGDVANITPTAFTFENVSRYPVQGFVGMKTRVNKKKKKLPWCGNVPKSALDSASIELPRFLSIGVTVTAIGRRGSGLVPD